MINVFINIAPLPYINDRRRLNRETSSEMPRCGVGRRLYPLPRKFWNFIHSNATFWCIFTIRSYHYFLQLVHWGYGPSAPTLNTYPAQSSPLRMHQKHWDNSLYGHYSRIADILQFRNTNEMAILLPHRIHGFNIKFNKIWGDAIPDRGYAVPSIHRPQLEGRTNAGRILLRQCDTNVTRQLQLSRRLLNAIAHKFISPCNFFSRKRCLRSTLVQVPR